MASDIEALADELAAAHERLSKIKDVSDDDLASVLVALDFIEQASLRSSVASDRHMEAARRVATDYVNSNEPKGWIELVAEALANAEREGMKRAAEMRELVISFVKDEIDYMTINHLGDPEQKHNIKWARKLGITPEETVVSFEPVGKL